MLAARSEVLEMLKVKEDDMISIADRRTLLVLSVL